MRPLLPALVASAVACVSLSTACTSSTHFGTGYRQTSSGTTAESGSSSSASAMRRDPFEGAPPYAAGLPDGRAATTHVNSKVGVVPSKDQKCLSCHGPGGDADAPRFVFAGSIYDGRDGTVGTKDAELGVVDANGKEHSAHSDEDGNFWFMGTETIAYPAYAAVRLGTAEKVMKRKVSDATELDCNSCHDKTNPIAKP